jgi:hypothetical protein
MRVSGMVTVCFEIMRVSGMVTVCFEIMRVVTGALWGRQITILFELCYRTFITVNTICFLAQVSMTRP